MRRRTNRVYRAELPCRCWCELHTVGVLVEDLRRGLTRPCASAHCQQLHFAAVEAVDERQREETRR